MTAMKLQLLLAELDQQAAKADGQLHLLYLDVDVVLMRNVMAELLALPARDVYLQSDEAHFESASVRNFCTGVALIAPTAGARCEHFASSG